MIKTTTSIKPTPAADSKRNPKLQLATSELMKIIALSMSGMSVRSYMGDMIEKLVEGGVLQLEHTEKEVPDDHLDDEEENDED